MTKRDRVAAIITDLKQHYFTQNEIELLPQGGGFSTATNFQLTCDGKHYLLRLFPLEMREETLQKELAITKLVGLEGIGPLLRYDNAALRFALIDYISGKTLLPPDLDNKACCQSIVGLLSKLHALKPDKAFKSFQLFDAQMQCISQLINRDEWRAFFDREGDIELQTQLHQSTCSWDSLIHGDINLSNIMQDDNGRLWFIDWTNAGFGSIYSDLSMLLSFMSDDNQQDFLNEYTKISGADIDMDTLAEFLLMRKFLYVTWALSQAQKMASDDEIPLDVFKAAEDKIATRDLVTDFLNGARTLDTKEDFLFLLSHYVKDYLEDKEKFLGKKHEQSPGF